MQAASSACICLTVNARPKVRKRTRQDVHKRMPACECLTTDAQHSSGHQRQSIVCTTSLLENALCTILSAASMRIEKSIAKAAACSGFALLPSLSWRMPNREAMLGPNLHCDSAEIGHCLSTCVNCRKKLCVSGSSSRCNRCSDDWGLSACSVPPEIAFNCSISAHLSCLFAELGNCHGTLKLVQLFTPFPAFTPF